jgi:hypothetical protein
MVENFILIGLIVQSDFNNNRGAVELNGTESIKWTLYLYLTDQL